jgi:hypothetical protein
MSKGPLPGSIEDGEWLRGEIIALGYSIGGFGRLMAELGDARPVSNILRALHRQMAGDSRVSGEMRAMIGALHRAQAVTPLPGSRRVMDAAAQ